MNATGFVLPVASVGLGSLLIRPRRGFFPSGSDVASDPLIEIAQAVLEEQHTDELEITEHPIEAGAPVSDHAYSRPAEVVIHCGWSDSPSGSSSLVSQAVSAGTAFLAQQVQNVVGTTAVAVGNFAYGAGSIFGGNAPSQVKEIYEKLRVLQVSRVPFDIYTGKRKYTDMLFKSLRVTTDRNSENSLMVTAHCRQVFIVKTQLVTVNSDSSVHAEPEKTAPPRNLGTKQLSPQLQSFGEF